MLKSTQEKNSYFNTMKSPLIVIGFEMTRKSTEKMDTVKEHSSSRTTLYGLFPLKICQSRSQEASLQKTGGGAQPHWMGVAATPQ